MLVSYSGYLRFEKKKDTFENFVHFVELCLKHDLTPVEHQEADYLYKSYRFANEYRLEV